ncbi:UNVERIFIED_CONTAM: hypothetical protein Slati_4487000 [Sesamum latifolium]|uniref:Uncharacterized protein n=1 Tax=Sesamum latifolium TaxID=2727402 RepID=A0AAW2STL8_9LAMI
MGKDLGKGERLPETGVGGYEQGFARWGAAMGEGSEDCGATAAGGGKRAAGGWEDEGAARMGRGWAREDDGVGRGVCAGGREEWEGVGGGAWREMGAAVVVGGCWLLEMKKKMVGGGRVICSFQISQGGARIK